MKRLRSSDELDSYGDRNTSKDTGNPKPNRSSSSSHRSFYYKSDNVRKGLVSPSSSSRYVRDRSLDDDNRMVRKRSEHDFDSFDRRKTGFDRYNNREGGFSGGSNDRVGIHRSESFSVGSRREFPKGFRSERDRSRREGSVSSWRRFGSGNKEFGGERKEFGFGNKEFEERGNSREERGRGLRDALKSPSWSRDSSSEQSRVRGLGESKSKSRSRSRSSPSWSKDSVGSEQSKSLEVVKKSEEIKMKSGNISSSSSSEMEEGELEPEGKPKSAPEEVKNENEAKGSSVLANSDNKEIDDGDKVAGDAEEGGEKESVSKGEKEGSKEDGDLLENEKLNVGRAHDAAYGNGIIDADDGGHKEGKDDGEVSHSKKVGEDKVVEKTPIEEKQNEEKGIDLGMKAEETEVLESNKKAPVKEEDRADEANGDMETNGLNQKLIDKGKQIADSLAADHAEDGVWTERESRIPLTWKADEDMEGPSTRGFDLFSSSPVRKAEQTVESVNNKDKDGKLSLEPLDLSLSLPNVLLPIGAEDTGQAPASPSHERSVQSLTNTFQTNSDGFTASMSFSGSQSFFHNPSCSLTNNSLDNFEQSVHSRPLFQGIDQVSQGACQGQFQGESSRHKDVPLYQKILMNGNGSVHLSQTSLEGLTNSQASQGQQIRVADGSAKILGGLGLERQLSFHKQNDVRSPSHSVGSHDIGSRYSFEKRRAVREKHGASSLYRSCSQKEQEFLIGSADFVETIILKIVSEPTHVVARKFHEMTGQPLSCLKESIREFMLNADKRARLCEFQNALESRSDTNMETLLKSHQTQLEILVALKTGLPEYLQLENSISCTDLAEIFLNLRCRNLMCRSSLPVDECDCKVCSKKKGFCSACMCLVCSKFDMASNTCSWVGCDVCLHWCHADCGLRESFIRNGHSTTGPEGLKEMQFHCVACDHPSEMFGFVKEVFQHFAKDWSEETMSKELEYVKRIFSASKDVRGRRLHDIAEQMLIRLSNKSHLPELLNQIMGFLTDSESSKFVNTLAFPEKEPVKDNNIGVAAGPSHEASWFKSVYSDKPMHLERSTSLLPSPHVDNNYKRPMESELQKNAQKEPLFDELESIVRIKLAEAKMFQARADDARREAEGLKRIAIAKSEKIEEEYTSRITKLQIVEAEEMRKQKSEEFQAMERAYREYFNMKARMEADIKDLLLKMEATRQNLAM